MMKRFLLSLIIISTSLINCYSQNFVEIGDGTVSTGYPFYSSWNYSWSTLIYNQTDIGEAKSITKIAFDVVGGAKTMTNQKIYFKHISDNEFSDASYEDPENDGYTLVYDDDIVFTSGWTEIQLSTPFEYNGTDNLIIHCENRWGQSYGPSFSSTASSLNNNKGQGSDTGFPTGSGYLNPYPNSLANIRLYYTSNAPATPVSPLPANNRIKVDLDTSLTFTLGTNTTTYDVYFGTDQASLSKVVDSETATVGLNTYLIPDILEPATKYFWQVIAKNDTETEESPVWNFTTQGAVNEFPWQEGFQEVVESSYDNTYYSAIINTNYKDSTDWEWNGSWGVTNGANVKEDTLALYCSPWSDGNFWVKTPRIILPAAQRISFWWRNGNTLNDKTSGNDTTFFQISVDGGANWESLDTLSPESSMSEYQNSIVDLSAYAGDNVYLRWYFQVNNQLSNIKLFIDDIEIDDVPSGAQLELNEYTHDFEDICINGENRFQLIIRNTGVTDLEVSDITSDGPFYCDYTGTIAVDGVDTTDVYFRPETTGSFNNELVINTNGATGDNTIDLSGTGLSLLPEFYETFDAAKAFPNGWGHIDSPQGYISGGGVDIISSSYDTYSQPNAAKIMVANDTVSPVLLIAPGVTNYNTNRLTFFAKKAGAAYQLNLIVGTLTDPYDANSFVPVKTIDLDTDFRSDTITFKPTTTAPYIAFKHGGSDGSDTYTSIRIDNIAWEEDVESVPLPVNLVYPTQNETEVDIMKNPLLKWTAGSSNTEKYVVYFGSSSTNFDIISGDTITNNPTSYELNEQLEYNSTYYWKVIPINNIGACEDNPIGSFTTMADPTISSLPWVEDFDNTTNNSGKNDCPIGWSIDDANGDNNTWDILTDNPDYEAFSHSAPNTMHVAFGFQPKDDYLYTPPFSLESGKTYKLTFWLHAAEDLVMGEVYKEKIKVFLGKDNEIDAMQTEIVSDSIETTVYKEVTAEFTVGDDDIYYLGFYAWSDAFMYLLIIDDVKLELANSLPEITSDPTLNVYSGHKYTYNMITTDEDGDDLTISATTIPDWLTLTDNGDGTAVLTGTPEQTGEFNVSLEASDGIGNVTQDFTLIVTENHIPQFSSQEVTEVNVDQTYTYNITATDDDGQDLVIFATTIPSWLTLTDNEDGTALLTGTSSEAGSFNVVLKVTDAIDTTSQAFNIAVSSANSVSDIITEGDVYLYPNPAVNTTTLKICNHELLPCKIQVFNVVGLPVYEGVVNSNEYTFELTGMNPGLYFVNITKGSQKIVHRLIIR